MRAAAAAEKLVPSGVVVAAADDLGPELSARATASWSGTVTGTPPPFAAPWVVADIRQPELGFRNLADQAFDVALLEDHGYRVLFQRNGILVLHRPGPARLGITARPLHIGPQPAR